MKHLPMLAGGAAIAALLSFQPAAAGSAPLKRRPLARMSAFQGKATDSGKKTTKQFSWDDLAEPGRKAADTLRRLREGNPEPVPAPSRPPRPGAPPSLVTITTPTWTIPPGAQGFNVALSAAETGIVVNGVPYGEQFGIMIPAGYNSATPPPIVIAWHGFGNSHNQPFPYLAAEANNRGWILMCPLGIADNTSGWLPGQQALDKSLEWIRANYPYDENHVFGVGFSMGALCVTNYAARHLNPSKSRFAALATVCGVFDNYDNYVQSPSTQALMQQLFGGPPYNAPFDFEYYRVSTLRLAMPLVYPYPPVEGKTMARTMSRIPLYMTWSTDDNVVPYSPTHNQSLITYLTSLGFAPTQVPQSGLALKHHWSVLNVVDCFNFFALQTLNPNPTSFSVLSDVQGSFHYTSTTGGTPGQFRRFDVSVNINSNAISIGSTQNIGNITLNLSDLGVTPGADLSISSSTADGTSDVVKIINPATPLPPSRVNLDAAVVYNWSFDGVNLTQCTVPAGTHAIDILYNTFDLNLAITGTPLVGATVSIDTSGGTDGELYWTIVSDLDGLTPLAMVGDGDPRWLLFDLGASYVVNAGVLANGGQDSVPVQVPNDPLISGFTFHIQEVTAPGSVSGIPFFFGRISNKVALTIP